MSYSNRGRFFFQLNWPMLALPAGEVVVVARKASRGALDTGIHIGFIIEADI
jgi:hypothetical protein